MIEVLDAPFSTSTGYSLLVGQTAQGVIASSLDQDLYKVNLVAGNTYTFALIGTGSNFLADPLLTLYSSQGLYLYQDDDGGPGLSSSLTYTASQTGTYYLGAYATRGTIGQYGLSFASGTVASFDLSMASAAEHSATSTTYFSDWSSIGTSATITYGFRDTGLAYDSAGNLSTFSHLTAVEIVAVREILGLWGGCL